jgi:hypothetical protein
MCRHRLTFTDPVRQVRAYLIFHSMLRETVSASCESGRVSLAISSSGRTVRCSFTRRSLGLCQSFFFLFLKTMSRLRIHSLSDNSEIKTELFFRSKEKLGVHLKYTSSTLLLPEETRNYERSSASFSFRRTVEVEKSLPSFGSRPSRHLGRRKVVLVSSKTHDYEVGH